MSPTAVKDGLDFYEPTSRSNNDLYTCDSYACKVREQDKDGVNGQTDKGPPKPQKEHLSPIEDVTPNGKYAQSPWDATSERVNGRLFLYFRHHR